MSRMYQLISDHPSVSIISTGIETPASPEDIKRLEEISYTVGTEIDSLVTGISAVAEIISISAMEDAETHKDRIIYLSGLVDIAASTVDGLRYIENQADSILAHRKRVDTDLSP
jgi:hypothetical protein